MSASRRFVTGLLMLLCSFGLAADDEIPDMEFLEYLGSWEESDEEWLIFADTKETTAEQRSDPVPEGEESTEKEDES